MTSLDHGKFTRMTTVFHSLLAVDVFLLFFSGYSIMFNDELWWLLVLMGGSNAVAALHRLAGAGLIALIVFWTLMMVTTETGRTNFRETLPTRNDVEAMLQDLKFVAGRVDERHPNARQFAGYSADEIPLLTYIGKGVVFIFAVELTLLSVSGLLIWSKVGLMRFLATKTAAMAFVVFHGLLGVIMMMGVMFHVFEHGFHPAFYPVETKAFIPKSLVPEAHAERPEGASETGIERLSLAPSWDRVTSVMGALTVIGIVSVLLASVYDFAYPVPVDLAPGGGPTSLLLVVGVNAGVFVLFVGLALSMYGNLLRLRWERELREREEESGEAVADGGDPVEGSRDDGGGD